MREKTNGGGIPSVRTVIVMGTPTQCRFDCYWPASETLARFGPPLDSEPCTWDGESDISRQEWPLHRLMKNKRLRPFLQFAKVEGLLW